MAGKPRLVTSGSPSFLRINKLPHSQKRRRYNCKSALAAGGLWLGVFVQGLVSGFCLGIDALSQFGGHLLRGLFYGFVCDV